jgi:hypothetical protein
MSRSPSLLQPDDLVVFKLANQKTAERVHQMVGGLNAAGILQRPLSDFQDAAREDRVIVAKSARTDLVLGVVLAAPATRNPATGRSAIELAALCVLRDACGHGLARVLVLCWVIRHIASAYYGSDTLPLAEVEWVAKVLAGNEDGPEPALVEAGFRRDGMLIELDPSEIQGISHMLRSGENHVYARRFSFDFEALDKAILGIYELLQRGTIQRRGITLRLAFDKRIVNRKAIEEHVKILRGRGGLAMDAAE